MPQTCDGQGIIPMFAFAPFQEFKSAKASPVVAKVKRVTHLDLVGRRSPGLNQNFGSGPCPSRKPFHKGLTCVKVFCAKEAK
jgi:hypothetical protein